MLSTELEQLVSYLGSLGRCVVDLLLPGVDEAAVRDAFGENVPPSVVGWFGWCNGVETARGQIQDEISIIPGRYPLSLTEALEYIDDYSEIFVSPGRWVPLLADGAGDLYAAVWAVGEQDAKIVDTVSEDSDNVAFASVSEMVAYFNRCYQLGAYFVDDSGMLSLNPLLAADLLPPPDGQSSTGATHPTNH